MTGECTTDDCLRPVYMDGRCKRCRDEWIYRTGQLDPPDEDEPVTLATLMAAEKVPS